MWPIAKFSRATQDQSIRLIDRGVLARSPFDRARPLGPLNFFHF